MAHSMDDASVIKVLDNAIQSVRGGELEQIRHSDG
jgi:hypothetical protein